jgi:phage shock protein A
MTQKLRKDINKHQSETKDTIKREIHELKKTTQVITDLNKDLEKFFLRRKNQTEIMETKSPYSETKITVEGHYSRLEQVEDRISELEDKMEIKKKKKPEEILVKQLKICERNIQELSNSIKRPNPRIMGRRRRGVNQRDM